MPWNLSASHRSSILQRNTFNRLSRAGSASYGASPLIGRGSNLLTLPNRLSRANSLVPGGGATSSIHGGDIGLGGGGFNTDNDTDMRDVDVDVDHDAPLNTQQQEQLEADFLAFGPAAQIDTQTAASSQWIKGVLDVEGRNFLEFVEAEVARLRDSTGVAGEGDDAGDDVGDGAAGRVTFETLLPPQSNSAVVAAQGLLHCLALATKGLLGVEQVEDFGEIWLRLLSFGGGGGGRGEDNGQVGGGGGGGVRGEDVDDGDVVV